MDQQTDRPKDQWTNGPTDGQTDKASYRVVCPQLKQVNRAGVAPSAPSYKTNEQRDGWIRERKKNFRVRRMKYVGMSFFSMSACFGFKGLGQGKCKSALMRTLW